MLNVSEFKEYKSKLYHDITNECDIFYAFSEKQLNEELEKRKLNTKDITSIGFGGYMPSKNSDTYKQKMTELDDIKEKWVKELKKHPALLKNAIKYELANYEYCVSYDSDVLLGTAYEYDIKTEDEIKLFNDARDEYLKECDY